MLEFIMGLIFGHILTDTRTSDKEVRNFPETYIPKIFEPR